ncbi:MAG: FAD-dependent oxidoreductase [Spartobacteria bacterium]|nr:FAD-dependent oxidoreductase [Spartobacteria bacterium]
MKTDILVAGGGSAGLAAAIAAARCGARVVLVERQSILGGMATSAHVHSICGLYQLRANELEPLLESNPGFPREFAQRLIREGGARGPVRMGRLDVVLHRPSSFAHLADRYVQSLPNLTVLLHTEITGVFNNGEGKIGELTLSSRGTRSDWEPSAVIDTTGDAELAQFTGRNANDPHSTNYNALLTFLRWAGWPQTP